MTTEFTERDVLASRLAYLTVGLPTLGTVAAVLYAMYDGLTATDVWLFVVMFVITAIALVGLIVFAVSAIGHFDPANLTNIAVDSGATGASSFLPHGYLGIWAAIPFAIWFFLAVEGVPLAAEETANPERNVPRGIIAAISVLILTCGAVLLLATGAGGAEQMSTSGNPLVEALGDGTAAKVVNYIGLAGLIASFFSIIYAYSRQTFALSRAGYLPTTLSLTNSRKAPTLALIIPGIRLAGQGRRPAGGCARSSQWTPACSPRSAPAPVLPPAPRRARRCGYPPRERAARLARTSPPG